VAESILCSRPSNGAAPCVNTLSHKRVVLNATATPVPRVYAAESQCMPNTPMSAVLIKRLRVSNELDPQDVRAIEALPIVGKFYSPHQKIVSDGDRPSESCLLVDGFVVRSKTTTTGERQILSIHIAGEIPDLQSLHLHVMDHDLSTLTGCTLGFIAHAAIRDLCVARPNVAAAFWRESLIDGAVFREWIVNVGRRAAVERLAHLIVELWTKLEAIGRARNNSFELPVTQIDLADCLGLTPVHVNRVLKYLRDDKLLETVRREYRLLDKSRLAILGQFNATYLHQSPSL
jgi:CRP-like cAMP-binding protein